MLKKNFMILIVMAMLPTVVVAVIMMLLTVGVVNMNCYVAACRLPEAAQVWPASCHW